jgi:GDP/UDP-N,N'-diacetylbacillosamine 2-epimerase (hydrolysing)
MKVAVLTSSRADYGIYRPLLALLEKDSFFDLSLLVFGTHLSEKFGNTIVNIYADKYKIVEKIDTLPTGDSPSEISYSIGKTIEKFSKVWGKHNFDIVVALGDRYEMFAAVSSAIPFNLKIAHIHGGETTLGAIDNSFRHAITLMSNIHFTAAEEYRKRVIEIVGNEKNVYNTGALSIDNIRQTQLLTLEQFKEKFGIDLSIPSILFTFHPETVEFERNTYYINEIICALDELKDYQIIITMPNSDTMGLQIRSVLNKFIDKNTNAIGVESFGSLGYLTCMKHCSILLGNTSSGFIEAAGFDKPVVNIGNRQKGRIITPNIFNSQIKKEEIINAISKAASYVSSKDTKIYGNGKAAEQMIKHLKNYANR